MPRKRGKRKRSRGRGSREWIQNGDKRDDVKPAPARDWLERQGIAASPEERHRRSRRFGRIRLALYAAAGLSAIVLIVLFHVIVMYLLAGLLALAAGYVLLKLTVRGGKRAARWYKNGGKDEIEETTVAALDTTESVYQSAEETAKLTAERSRESLNRAREESERRRRRR